MPSVRPAAPRGCPPRGPQREHENPPDKDNVGRRKSTPLGRREPEDPPDTLRRRKSKPTGEDIATIAAHLFLRWETASPLLAFQVDAVVGESTGSGNRQRARDGENRPHGPNARRRQNKRDHDADTARALARNAGRFPRAYKTALVLNHVRQPQMGRGLRGFQVDLIFLDTRYAIARLPTEGAPEGVWLRFSPPSLSSDTGTIKAELRSTLTHLGAQTGVHWGKANPPRAIAALITSEYAAKGRTGQPSVEDWSQDAGRVHLAVDRLAREWDTEPAKITNVPWTRLFYRFHFVVTSIKEAVQWSLDDTLELLLPALNGIPNSIAFARAVDRLMLLHSLCPEEIAHATTWLAALCAVFAPTNRPIVLVREIMCHVHFAFHPPPGHAEGAAEPRNTHPQDKYKERWAACATARATIMRGEQLSPGECAPEDLCSPCCEATRSPVTGEVSTRAFLQVLAAPCQLASHHSGCCATESTGTKMKQEDTPMRCNRHQRCRFSESKCYPPTPRTEEEQATLPLSITELELPIILPEEGEGQTGEPRDKGAEPTAGRSPDVQVIDLDGNEEENPGRARQLPRKATPNTPCRQGCARAVARATCSTGRMRDGSTGRRRRRKRGVTRTQDDHDPSPRRRAEGETFTLRDGLRRTPGAICDHCGYANHTARDCRRRRLALREAEAPNARASHSPPTRRSAHPGTSGRQASRPRARDPPTAPRVAFCSTSGYQSSESDSPAGHDTPPRRLGVHARLGHAGGRRGSDRRGDAIAQIDGAEEIPRSRSPSINPTGSEGEEDEDDSLVLARRHWARDEEIPDLTSSSDEEIPDLTSPSEEEVEGPTDDRDSGDDDTPAWNPPEAGITMAPLTHPGYHITALVAGRLQRFLLDSGLPFSCIRQEDLRRIRESAHPDSIRPAWGGGVTMQVLFLHLGVKEVTLHVLPRDSELESSLGWDALAEWNARIEFSHDSCSCPPDRPHLATPGACSPLEQEPEPQRGPPFH